MILLSKIKIKHYNDVIVARNKVYRLVLDVQHSLIEATRMAIFTSEMLRLVLTTQSATEITFLFTKHENHYFLHILVSCDKENSFAYAKYRSIEKKHYLELLLKVINSKFVPDINFLQTERERLIQQSGGEMLQEIRRKNIELNKTLQEFKSSAQMIQSEKMRALGVMTAGVAHELNNPMMGILNFVQYAIKHTDKEDRRYLPLIDAENEVKRCQDIIDNLLTFSRMKAEGVEKYTRIKFSKLCKRILKLQNYKLHSFNIRVIEHYPEDELPVRMKSNKMQEVILNMITNAIDAMQACKHRELILNVQFLKDEVEFTVTDTGTGIDEETLDKIFEPFFTTKCTGQGTGLGLSVSKSIVEEHHGVLQCYSRVGEGTCFMIRLPTVNH